MCLVKNEKVQKEDVDIKASYGKEATLSKEEFLKTYQIKESGLSEAEAESFIQKYGFNEIKQEKPKRWYHYFLESLFSPFNCILLRDCSHFMLYRCLSSRNT